MNGTVKTKPELESMLQDFKKLHTDPHSKGATLMMCDNLESVAQTFLESGDGLNIGAFADIAGVNVDTVRHWVEFGVVSPFSLNGKFKFMPPHLLELRSVQQWQGLGLTLEQIKERKAQGMAFVPSQPIQIGEEVIDGGLVQMFYSDDPKLEALGLQTPDSGNFAKLTSTQNSKNALATIKADFDAQIAKLEQQHLETAKKIANAKALRARLEIQP
jgi:DNA-binding transcriptional MerR regulator